MSNNFREELVNEVRALGQYIAANADQLVDRCDKKTEFNIYYRHDPMGLPTVQITQEHAVTYAPPIRFTFGAEEEEKK